MNICIKKSKQNVSNVRDMTSLFDNEVNNKPWWYIESNELRKKTIDSVKVKEGLELEINNTNSINKKIKL